MNRPTGGADPQDSRSTEQFWAAPPAPSGPGPQGPPGPAAQQPPGLQQHYARDRRHAVRWTIGLTLALVLAAGGVLAGVALASHGTPASSASPAGDTSAASQARLAGRGAEHRTERGRYPGHADPHLGRRQHRHHQHRRHQHRPQQRGGHAASLPEGQSRAPRGPAGRTARTGQGGPGRRGATAAASGGACSGCSCSAASTGSTPSAPAQGTIRTLAFERGVIQSVSGSDIVVRAVDGTTWSWNLVSDTVVREDGAKDLGQRTGQRRAGVGGRAGGVRGQGRAARGDPATERAQQPQHRPPPRQRRQHPAADRRCYRLPQAPAAAGAGSLCWPSSQPAPSGCAPR